MDWGAFQKLIPVSISVKRTAQLTRAICLLHNFCINNNESKIEDHDTKDLLQIVNKSGNVMIKNKPKKKRIPYSRTQG